MSFDNFVARLTMRRDEYKAATTMPGKNELSQIWHKEVVECFDYYLSMINELSPSLTEGEEWSITLRSLFDGAEIKLRLSDRYDPENILAYFVQRSLAPQFGIMLP